MIEKEPKLSKRAIQSDKEPKLPKSAKKLKKFVLFRKLQVAGGGLTVDCETKRTFCKLSSDWSKKVRKKVRKLQVAGGLPVDCETKRTFCKPPSDWSLQTPCQHLRPIPGNIQDAGSFCFANYS